MIRFFLSRLAFGALVLLMLSIFVFVLFYVSPSDPARIIAGDKATEALMAQIRVNLGLDKPMLQQYFMFLGNLLQGDLGFSYRTNLPVGDLLVNRIPVTMSLVFLSLIHIYNPQQPFTKKLLAAAYLDLPSREGSGAADTVGHMATEEAAL